MVKLALPATKVVVKGLHYPQEDSPAQVGIALVAWLQTITR